MFTIFADNNAKNQVVLCFGILESSVCYR